MVCPNWLLASLLPGRHCIVGGSVLVMAGALVRGLARVRRNGTAIPIRVECLPLSAAPVRGAVLQSGCRSLSGVDSSCAWGGGNRDSTRFLLPSPCHPLMAQVGRRRRLATASEILCRVSVNSFLGKAMGRTSWTPPSTILKTVFPGGGIAEIMERPVHREGCSDWLLGHSPGRQGGWICRRPTTICEPAREACRTPSPAFLSLSRLLAQMQHHHLPLVCVHPSVP